MKNDLHDEWSRNFSLILKTNYHEFYGKLFQKETMGKLYTFDAEKGLKDNLLSRNFSKMTPKSVRIGETILITLQHYSFLAYHTWLLLEAYHLFDILQNSLHFRGGIKFVNFMFGSCPRSNAHSNFETNFDPVFIAQTPCLLKFACLDG